MLIYIKIDFYNNTSPKKLSTPNHHEYNTSKPNSKIGTPNNQLSKNGSKASILNGRDNTPPAKHSSKPQINYEDYKKNATPKKDGPKTENIVPKTNTAPGNFSQYQI